MEETCVSDVTDIIKNAREELKRFSKYGFRECLQHIHSRLQKCIFVRGIYFEANLASIIESCIISQRKVIERKF
jgi:hypothetical protein